MGCDLDTEEIRTRIRAISEVKGGRLFDTLDFINYCGLFEENNPELFHCTNVTIQPRCGPELHTTNSRQYCGRVLADYSRETGNIRRIGDCSPAVWEIVRL